MIGCLRKLQHWSLTSILSEVKLFKNFNKKKKYILYAGKKSRYSNEQCIELFDVDLVTLPPKKYLPEWFSLQEQMFKEEIEEFQKKTLQNGEKIFKNHDILNQTILDKNNPTCSYEVYYFCNDGPLISSKSSYDEKKSIIEIED